MKVIFFDFDGTVVDSKEAYYDAIWNTLKVFGFKYEDIDKAIDFGFSLKRTLYKLGFGKISTWFLKRRIMSKVKKQVNEVHKCRDISVLRELHGKKILVTNSLREFVIPVLKHLKIKKYFREIYGADDFGDKAKFLKDYIKRHKINNNDCYYVGDRMRDVEVAKKSGCQSVIISNKCSWDSPSELKRAKPDYLVHDLGGMKKIFR